MKSSKKALAFALAAAMVVTAFPVTNTEAATTAKLNKKSVTVAAGTAAKQTKSIKVTTPSTWKSVKVKVSSSDKKIATVKASGKTVKVTAVKKGSTKVTVKVTAKKAGKAVSKTLKANVKVVGAGLKFTSDAAEVNTGATLALSVKKVPSVAKITYTSSDTTVATVSEDGVVTGVKAGKATITAESDYGKKVTKEITVADTVAKLSAVTQKASNAFDVTFTADASKAANKDNVKVTSADATAAEMSVKSVEFSKDGLTAHVTLFNNLKNDVAYNVVYDGVTVPFTAKVGEVATVAIKTASAEKDVATKIEFTLLDANGIDVTPSANIDATCLVTATGNFTGSSLVKASTATITMGKVGDTADVTVTYNSNKTGAQDVTATQKITCVANTATVGGDVFYQTKNDTNKLSLAGRFYNNKKSAIATANLAGSSDPVYFCATNKNGDAINYDSYTVESANEGIALATVDTSSNGKYAKIDLTGIAAGKTQINIKAEKNGVATYYTVPVEAKKVGVAATMTVKAKYTMMSDVKDTAYVNTIEAQLYDKDGNKVAGNYIFTNISKVATGSDITVSGAQNGNKISYSAAGANAQTYTIQVEGSDNVDGKTITKNISFTVKHLDLDKKYDLSYQVEVDTSSFDGKISPYTIDKNGADSSKVKTRLYATANGLFAGYVRATAGGSAKVSEEAQGVQATTKTAIDTVNVGAKYGTLLFTDDNGSTKGLTDHDGDKEAVSGSALNNSGSVDTEFAVVTTSAIAIEWNNVDTNKKYDTIARTGSYSAVYYVVTKQAAKDAQTATTKTGKYVAPKVTNINKSFTIADEVVTPTVNVLSKTPDTLDETGAKACMITNVDMNNVEANASITVPNAASTDYSSNGTRYTVRNVEVKDDYTYTDGAATKLRVWNFTVPINTTFRAE